MHNQKEEYLRILENKENKGAIIKNTCAAFFFGGIVGLTGELIRHLYINVFNIPTELGGTYMVFSVILFAAIMSAFGVYDSIGQIGKAGLAIPISGFANSVISAAMEYKPEGFLLGIGANAFKLAGSVIVLGVFSAVLFNLIRYTIEVIL